MASEAALKSDTILGRDSNGGNFEDLGESGFVECIIGISIVFFGVEGFGGWRRCALTEGRAVEVGPAGGGEGEGNGERERESFVDFGGFGGEEREERGERGVRGSEEELRRHC